MAGLFGESAFQNDLINSRTRAIQLGAVADSGIAGARLWRHREADDESAESHPAHNLGDMEEAHIDPSEKTSRQGLSPTNGRWPTPGEVVAELAAISTRVRDREKVSMHIASSAFLSKRIVSKEREAIDG